MRTVCTALGALVLLLMLNACVGQGSAPTLEPPTPTLVPSATPFPTSAELPTFLPSVTSAPIETAVETATDTQPATTNTETPTPRASTLPAKTDFPTRTPAATNPSPPTATFTPSPSRTFTRPPTATFTHSPTTTPNLGVGLIRGFVTQAGSNLGLGGVTVYLTDGQNITTRSSNDGSYLLANVPAGSYSIVAQSPLGSSNPVSVVVTANYTTTQNLVIFPALASPSPSSK